MNPQDVAALLRAAVASLRAAQVPDPARDARLLLAGALGIEASRLILHPGYQPTPEESARFAAFLAARCARQPVSQILGQRAFYGRSFTVTPDVLDPRPETETLIAAALAGGFSSVLDLGTGPGTILLSLLAERPGARGLGCDISVPALRVARENRDRFGLAARAQLRPSDWLAGVTGRFDLITCNPPYIDAAAYDQLDPEPRLWEPRIALTPGPDGLAPYRLLAPQLADYLTPGGRVLFEVGATQGPAVMALLRAAGARDVTAHADLDGRARAIAAVWGGA